MPGPTGTLICRPNIHGLAIRFQALTKIVYGLFFEQVRVAVRISTTDRRYDSKVCDPPLRILSPGGITKVGYPLVAMVTTDVQE